MAGGTVSESRLAPYPVAAGIEGAAAAWRTGPAAAGVSKSTDLAVAGALKSGISSGFPPVLTSKLRFPVLVSWDFVCTADGGFERLMNDLDVGLLGTVDQAQPPAGLEVAATGHIALPHRTRRGEPAVSWYRGPLGPQPTVRAEAVDGVLALAHTADQLRRLVPDGREDISLAVLFEIGRLLTLNKPTLVAQLMQWRRDLFGAARARELADQLAGSVLSAIGGGAVGGRNALEELVRSSVVGAFTAMPADALARSAPAVTTPRVPVELAGLSPAETLNGLGLDPDAVGQAGKLFGVDGLGQVPVTAPPAPAGPAGSDKVSMAGMTAALGQRVDDLVVSVLKTDGVPPQGVRPRRRRRKDTLDRLIEEAGERPAGGGTEG
jgi:hypothetical protein